jgi:hypothetical protein
MARSACSNSGYVGGRESCTVLPWSSKHGPVTTYESNANGSWHVRKPRIWKAGPPQRGNREHPGRCALPQARRDLSGRAIWGLESQHRNRSLPDHSPTCSRQSRSPERLTSIVARF